MPKKQVSKKTAKKVAKKAVPSTESPQPEMRTSPSENLSVTGERVDFPLAEITVDPKYQTRVHGLDEETVKEYRQVYTESPKQMPPIRIVRVGDKNILAAGHQRYEGARRAGLEKISAVVVDGDEKTAMRIALGSNRHGLKLSPGDKKKAILMALEAFSKCSNGKIAALIGCAESYVRKVLDSQVRTSADLEMKCEGKDGKMYPRKQNKSSAPPSSTSEEKEKEDTVEICDNIEAEDLERNDDNDPHAQTPSADLLVRHDDCGVKTDDVINEVDALFKYILETYRQLSEKDKECFRSQLLAFLSKYDLVDDIENDMDEKVDPEIIKKDMDVLIEDDDLFDDSDLDDGRDLKA